MTDTIAPTMTAPKAAAPTLTDRVAVIDMLRGLVIVLMTLDHVRDYFLAGAATINPLDPEQTTPLLYLTRWITHLCAPTFVLLAGTAAFLQGARGKTTPQLSLFLLTRGLWLVALELTIIGFGWSFALPYAFLLQVIWAIGWSMIALAALVWLPHRAVLVIGAAIILGHNLLGPISTEHAGWIWTFVHDSGPVFLGEQPIGFLAYPVLPWLGIMLFGYGLGPVFLDASARRDRTLLLLGAAMLALFVLLRAGNLYGDPQPWQAGADEQASMMNFFNVAKYPPSLLYVCATLGIVFVLTPLLARLKGPVAKVLITFGAVPLFAYVLHIYIAHGLAIAANAAAGNDTAPFFGFMANLFTAPQKFDGTGFPLGVTYLAWIAVLAILYPLCLWFAQVKRTRRDWWLSYL